MSWWSNQRLSNVSDRIAAEIDAYYTKHAAEISHIILCGYSLGAMLVRRAFLDASGLGYPEGQKRPWAAAVERIVLVGAICRGFHFSRLPFQHRVVLWLAARLGLAKALRSAFVGEPWASNVRLDWITYWRDHETRPRVVNIRGTEDNLVYDEDAVDVEKDPLAAYVKVIGANHDSVIQPTEKNFDQLLEAFVGDPAARVAPVTESKDRVYFLLHGMRSSKYFMQELAERLRHGTNIVVRNLEYDYISLLAFLSPSYRHVTASKFTDEFIQRFAENPHARFIFAGHSNGTCILGEAIQNAPRMKFDRLYFGGSALPRSFDWHTLISRKQVYFVRSDHGSKDWAVGILARAIEQMSPRLSFLRGVGSGGYDGFKYGDLSRLNEPWFEGYHSAMFEKGIDSIVDFLTAEERRTLPETKIPAPRWFDFLHKYGDIAITAGVVLYLAAIIRLILVPIYPVSFLPGASGLYLAATLLGTVLFALKRF
jgi:hypothetical protein